MLPHSPGDDKSLAIHVCRVSITYWGHDTLLHNAYAADQPIGQDNNTPRAARQWQNAARGTSSYWKKEITLAVAL